MSEDNFHFEVPRDNIRNEKYEKTGGGLSVTRLNYVEHGLKLKKETEYLKSVELNRKDSSLTSEMFLQVKTPDEFSLKGQTQKIEQLGFKIISYSAVNKSIGTASISKQQFSLFEKKLDEYIQTDSNVGKTYFSPIEEIASIPIEEKIKTNINVASSEEISIIINLFNYLSAKEKMLINGSIIEEIKKYTQKVNYRNFVNGITSIECTITSKSILLILSEFSTIKEIKPNQTFFVEQALPADKIPINLKVLPFESSSIICIIDSGVKNDKGFFNTLIVDHLPYLPAGSSDCAFDHGTFVASRCLFGDNIDNCLSTFTLQPYCKILDVAIFGVDTSKQMVYPTEFHLRSVVEDVVLKYHNEIKVYNLSLGTGIAVRDYEFSEFAKLLDFLSKTYKVLFIVAAGNIDEQLGNFPDLHFGNQMARIGSPAESLLSLTVGSIAKYANDFSLSSTDYLSPFSRIGPGSDKGVKPEIVAHGGNLVHPYTFTPRISTYGIGADGENFAVDVGTSHAAPLISQFAQKLFDYYPNSDPNLVKGLMCHFSEPRYKHNTLADAVSKYLGFGEPNIDKALFAGNFNAAYIYEGQLDQENYQFVTFDIPASLAASAPSSKLKVKITITYDPPVNPHNELEYSCSRISAKLFKPTGVQNKPIDISGDNSYNLPWNPIIQFEKTFSRSYLAGSWELRLRLYTRGDVQEDYKQDYSVVIEIIDEGKTTNVYRDIESEFGHIYKKIKIKTAA